MTTVEAIFENGVFKPVGPVALREKQACRSTSARSPHSTDSARPDTKTAAGHRRARRSYSGQHAGYCRRPESAMADVATDSSVAAKWVLPESDTARKPKPFSFPPANPDSEFDFSTSPWRRWPTPSGCEVCGLITPEESHDALADFLALPMEISAVPRPAPWTLRLSIRYRVAVYDSLFVALSAAGPCSGFTADEPRSRRLKPTFRKYACFATGRPPVVMAKDEYTHPSTPRSRRGTWLSPERCG